MTELQGTHPNILKILSFFKAFHRDALDILGSLIEDYSCGDHILI